MKKKVFSQALAPLVPAAAEAAEGLLAIEGAKDVGKKVIDTAKGLFSGENPAGSEIEQLTEWNELANTFKDVFHLTDPNLINAEKLRAKYLNTTLAREPKEILPLIKQMKDTLFAVSGFKDLEPNIAQLLANFTIDLLDRTSSAEQVKSKLKDLQDKASDTENPKDAYIIALLNGNYQTANLLLLLSDVGKIVSRQTMQDITANQQLANKMLGKKSEELINAKYLDNAIAAKNAAEIQKSLALYQVMIPLAAQKANWQRDVNNYATKFYNSDQVRQIAASDTVTSLGGLVGLGQGLQDVFKAPIKSLFR